MGTEELRNDMARPCLHGQTSRADERGRRGRAPWSGVRAAGIALLAPALAVAIASVALTASVAQAEELIPR